MIMKKPIETNVPIESVVAIKPSSSLSPEKIGRTKGAGNENIKMIAQKRGFSIVTNNPKKLIATKHNAPMIMVRRKVAKRALSILAGSILI